MTARERRLMSDYEQVRKDFAGHKNIIVTPVGDEPPEKYNITYFVNGIYLLPDGKIETLGRHEVEITLHADYPRYKPICKINTPIWHPNFRDGQICIGDIWGAGESLSDIIINIGDMIQYKSWNSFSPLSADAAQWAMENKHLFPVGNIELNIADYASAKDTVEIDLFGEDGEKTETASADAAVQFANSESNEMPVDDAVVDGVKDSVANPVPVTFPVPAAKDENDFEITAEELSGIEFVPTAQRMQNVSQGGGTAKGGKVNFKTVLVKGLIWAIIGAFVGFGIGEFISGDNIKPTVAGLFYSKNLQYWYEYNNKANAAWEKGYSEYESWCAANNKDSSNSSNFTLWTSNYMSSEAEAALDDYLEYDEMADGEFYDAYYDDFDGDEDKVSSAVQSVNKISTGAWFAIIALMIGLFLGIGEGVFYGSKEKAVKYGALGAGISIVLGFISGYLGQWMYAEMINDDTTTFTAALIRGLGWAILGLGVGVSIGLIKPEQKRILFCGVGGLGGGFLGGFLFNFICDLIPNDIVARGAAIIIMGALIGIGVGLLEQMAKRAWLKVIRGEFEGKEYLVFAGTTSIGNNSKNTIVLFKDKLVGPHHCDIVLEGSKYVLVDCGTPMGTVVNGMKTNRHILRQGDAIAIGNSVLVFNTAK